MPLASVVVRRKEADCGGRGDVVPKVSVEFGLVRTSGHPVECLGLTFESEEARHEYFRARLKEKLPELRQRPDFLLADDEDILRLSDPPYYTACPNPFLAEFVQRHGRPYDPDEPYHREPFAVDVSAGKTNALYRAHGYHTKVPHLAIVPSILHYTQPGDVVLDGFCGSGMTGVAAQWCGAAPPAYRRTLEQRWHAEGRPPPAWGTRRVVLGDLSPAATFIAANYNLPFDVEAFHAAAGRLLEEVEAEIGWMYETRHTDGRTTGRINYTVWSEVFLCPNCAGEVGFLDEALDPATRRTRTAFPCPHCAAKLTKDNLVRSFETLADPASGKPWKRIRLRPVLIHYSVDGARHEKAPDDADLVILDRVAGLPLPPGGADQRLPHRRDVPRIAAGAEGVHARASPVPAPSRACPSGVVAARRRVRGRAAAERLAVLRRASDLESHRSQCVQAHGVLSEPTVVQGRLLRTIAAFRVFAAVHPPW